METEADNAALNERHALAVAQVNTRSCAEVAQLFEAAVQQSTAVINRPPTEALRLANSDNEAYSTYDKLLHAGVRLPEEGQWDRLRGLAGIELFGVYRDEIRFAALWLSGPALPQYGSVDIHLKEEMIAHRATVFEENSALFFERKRREGEEPPKVEGHRARWEDRGKLAFAKCSPELDPTHGARDFGPILLRSGSTPREDVFIEVHIFGSLTKMSIERMRIDPGTKRDAILMDLRSRLDQARVPTEFDA